MPYDKSIPSIPPDTVSITDSTRNCSIMSLFLAPIAFLMPISFVRSDTVTRRIFITPMPHTMSDIAATPQRNALSMVVMLLAVSSISAWF